MTIIKNLENNIKKMEKYVDIKKDKLSEVLKFFHNDMIAFDMSYFAKTEQVRIFEKAFDREIKYITYVSIFNRLSKDKSSTKMFHNDSENDTKNEVENMNYLASENRINSEDKKAISNDSKKESKEEIRVRKNNALDNLENNDDIASEFNEFK